MEKIISKQKEKHGKYGTPEYNAWRDMKGRCLNSKHKWYPSYGGRGITICEEWKNSFICFYNDMGKKPKGFSLDRVDNNKGYYKKNCKWSSSSQQQKNKRNSRYFDIGEGKKHISFFSKKYHTHKDTIMLRLKKGWDVIKAVTTKSKPKNTLYLFRGEHKLLSKWCDIFNMKEITVRQRLTLGWDLEKALLTPPDQMRLPKNKRNSIG